MNPVRMLVTYRPKPGKEEELRELVAAHWSVLDQAGLSTPEPATVYRAMEKRSGRVYFVEIFSWKDEHASGKAHETPEVMALWGRMQAVLESMELAAIEPVRR